MSSTITFLAAGRSGCMVTIDEADWVTVKNYRWFACRRKGSFTRYVQAIVDGKMTYLHRLLMSPTADQVIDHIDGNALNNSRANLRIVTQSENQKSARRLPGRYGNATDEELDAELAEFESRLGY